MAVAKTVEDLEVYQRAFALQQRIFEISKTFPKEERYSLTDQIRRASRAVGANISEAWQKRRYEAHFVSKLSDADAELAETGHWLRSALACGYITDQDAAEMTEECRSIGKTLGGMMNHAESWCR